MTKLWQIRCGVRDCGWTRNAQDECFTVRFGLRAFDQWRKHLVESHGLNPNLDEPVGLETAQLFFDHVEGPPSVLTIHAIDKRSASQLPEQSAEGECGRPCPPSQACDECAEYWDRMRREGLWDDAKGWTEKGWKSITR